MIFLFVVDPEEGKVFPKIDVPADLGPDYISVLGMKITEDEIKASDAGLVTIDPDAESFLVLDGKAGDVFAYFFHIPAFKDIIAVMPKRSFSDNGAKVIFSYDTDSHFLNALNKLAPSVRLSGLDKRTVTSRGINIIPTGLYNIDLIYALMELVTDVKVDAIHVSSGIKVSSANNIDFSEKGIYLVTVGGTGEQFFPITGSVIKTGFTYIVYAE